METTSDNLGLPPRNVRRRGHKRNTHRSFHEADGKLYLQGIERRGWSAVIDKETGHMTVTASPDNAVIQRNYQKGS